MQFVLVKVLHILCLIIYYSFFLIKDPDNELDPRVIGGRDALDGEFPWMVSVFQTHALFTLMFKETFYSTKKLFFTTIGGAALRWKIYLQFVLDHSKSVDDSGSLCRFVSRSHSFFNMFYDSFNARELILCLLLGSDIGLDKEIFIYYDK